MIGHEKRGKSRTGKGVLAAVLGSELVPGVNMHTLEDPTPSLVHVLS